MMKAVLYVLLLGTSRQLWVPLTGQKGETKHFCVLFLLDALRNSSGDADQIESRVIEEET
jgi:hypothetical protein